MRKTLPFLFGCTFALLAPTLALAQPDAAEKKLPYAGQPAPAELQVFAPFVGQWSMKGENRRSLQNPEPVAVSGEVSGQWMHNGHFLSLTSTTSSGKFREEATVLYGYDAQNKVYLRWLFSSRGLAAQSVGTWNETTHTMTWKPQNPPPNASGSVVNVLTKDRVETTVQFKRADGQMLVDVTLTMTKK